VNEMAAKKTNVALKKGKKHWCKINSSKLFGEAMLGESYVYEAEELIGKYVTANLSVLTKNMRKQNGNVQFRVISIKDGIGQTEVVSYSMVIAAVKRLVRRGRDKVADSFIAKTADKKLIRIKPLSITKNYTTNSITTACRLESRRIVREFVITKTFEEVIDAIVSGKLPKIIKDGISKIYPMKSVDIRMAKLEENTRIVITDKAVTSEPVKQRKLSMDKDGQKWKDKKDSQEELDDYDVDEEGNLITTKKTKKEVIKSQIEEIEEGIFEEEEEKAKTTKKKPKKEEVEIEDEDLEDEEETELDEEDETEE
jgi:small subunit ribosomal protein S3Ae